MDLLRLFRVLQRALRPRPGTGQEQRPGAGALALFAFRSAPKPAPRPTPQNTTILAIGDVHGHRPHLDAMLDLLAPLIETARTRGHACHLVMIGDYIDRGPDNLGVLRRLLDPEERLGIPVHALRGNHDQDLIDFILADRPDPEGLRAWCRNGGDGLLAELGITSDDLQHREPRDLAAMARERAGPEILGLLRRLELHRRIGDYVFVHAGVHPSRPLTRHEPRELMTLREPFLSTGDWRQPFAVVHGHTIRGPEICPHRITIDSGCYRTGVLTALILADDMARFIGVTSRPDLKAFRQLKGPRQLTFTAPEPIPARS